MAFRSFGGLGKSTSAPTSAQPASAPTFSFSSPTTTSQQAAGASSSPFSFGASSNQPAQSNQQATGSSNAPFSFGLSGSSQPAQPAAGTSALGGSLFGSKPATTTPTTAPTAGTSGGLFSGFGGQNTQQPAQQGGGLFGQQNAAKPAGVGLFGSTAQPASGGGLFGSTSQQATGGGLFGSTSAQPQQNSLFGQPPAMQTGQTGLLSSQPQNQLQGSTSTSGLSKTTKFSDAPEPVQKTMEQLDSWIKQQKQAGEGIDIARLGGALRQTSAEVRSATEEASALTQGLAALQTSLKQLQAKFVAEEEDIRRIAEIWDTYKSVEGRPGAMRISAHSQFPSDFFGRIAEGMEERVTRYRSTITQLQRAITSLANESETPSPDAIATTISNHQTAILNLAAQLEALNARLDTLRAGFSETYRDRTGSARNPFEVAREEKGLPILRA